MRLPYMNWGIYEQDIVYLGGSVAYTGNIISKSRRSIIEEAVVSAGNASCNVLMERFPDGSAVIRHFVKQGLIYEKKLYPEAQDFWYQFHSLAEDNIRYMSFDMVRKIKQYLTFAVQCLCILIFMYGLYYLLFTAIALKPMILLVLSAVLFVLLTRFYSWYRTSRIEDHKFT